LLDGTDINDHANGTPGGAAGTNLGVDGVQEFKINTSVSPAEYGRSSGGTISAVTRSGTNGLHGSAFEFLRNNDLDSLGYFDYKSHGGTDSIAPYRRNQFGGALGGAIKKDQTFFFGTYEGLRQGNGTNINSEVPTAAAKQVILPYAAFQGTDPKLYNCNKGDTACMVPLSPVIKPYLDLFQAPTPGPTTGDLGDGTGWKRRPYHSANLVPRRQIDSIRAEGSFLKSVATVLKSDVAGIALKGPAHLKGDISDLDLSSFYTEESAGRPQG
jgi:hypothetical protein